MHAIPLASVAVLTFFTLASAQTPLPTQTATPQAPGQPRPGQPPRDPQKQPITGTARIKGRVVSAEGTPLRRAMVRASAPELRESRSTMTDAQGAYELKDLPAGRYMLMASKGSYVMVQFGQRRPFEPGRPIELVDDQVMDKADFTLPRGSVIVGRVVDEFGEPAADATVQAMHYRFMGGQRRLVSAGRFGQVNDIGQFRLYGLPPGEYFISASLRSGGFGFMETSDVTTGYAPTYYPGTPNVNEAQRVTIGVGQELTSIDFALIPTRTARVSGTVTDSRGRPVANAMVMMVQRMGSGMMTSTGAQLRPDGTFTMSSVPPGDYTLSVQPRMPEEEAETGSVSLTVTGDDITGLSIVTSVGARARGQIVFEGGSPPASTGTAMISAQSSDPFGGPPMGFRPARILEDWSFELKGLQGKRILRVGGLPGWTLKSVHSGGADVTDSPIEFSGTEEIANLRVVLTSQITEITGTVTDGKSAPARDYIVVAFAEDEAKWGPGTRFVRTARPDQEGLFKVRELPSGNYALAALEYLGEGEWQDPEVLARLRARATRVTLMEGEKKTVTLKLSPGS